ncbi:hypothetical protein MHU86_12615 [Fragilaria crotonensis]|nr:hypothetical protein MHU86_12615 [Fragilaria crotonensis]
MSIPSSPPTHPDSSVYETPYKPSSITSPSNLPAQSSSFLGINDPKPPHHQNNYLAPIPSLLQAARGAQFTTPQDAAPRKFYGDDVYLKHPDAFRIFFQNVKGLTYSSGCEDYKYCLHNLSTLSVDIAGLSETNTPWNQLAHLQSDFRRCLRRQFSQCKVEFGSPSTEIDPVKVTDVYQAGGNLSFAHGSLVPMLSGDSNLQDPSGLGRWSGLTFRGKQSQYFTVLTGYRTCRGSISSSSLGSTYHREYSFMKANGNKQPDPRQAFFTDITILITSLQARQHSVLLMLDANSTLYDAGFLEMQTTCQLQDLQASSPATSTYMGALDRRIDFMLGCSKVVSSMRQQGTLSYYDGPLSDHRGLYVDLDLHSLLGYTPQTFTIPRSDMRLLKAGNPELVEDYVTSMHKYYHDHDMTARINWLYDTHKTMTRPAIRRILEKWDSDQGKAMQMSERSLQRTPQRHQWSPELRNAGLLRSYWRLRLQDAQQQTNHSSKSIASNHRSNNTTQHMYFPTSDLPHIGRNPGSSQSILPSTTKTTTIIGHSPKPQSI